MVEDKGVDPEDPACATDRRHNSMTVANPRLFHQTPCEHRSQNTLTPEVLPDRQFALAELPRAADQPDRNRGGEDLAGA